MEVKSPAQQPFGAGLEVLQQQDPHHPSGAPAGPWGNGLRVQAPLGTTHEPGDAEAANVPAYGVQLPVDPGGTARPRSADQQADRSGKNYLRQLLLPQAEALGG